MWNGVRSKAFFVGSGVPRGGGVIKRKIFQFVYGSSTEYVTQKKFRLSPKYNLCKNSRIRR